MSTKSNKQKWAELIQTNPVLAMKVMVENYLLSSNNALNQAHYYFRTISE